MRKAILLISILSAGNCTCWSFQNAEAITVQELALSFNTKDIELASVAEAYVDSAVAIMRREAIHRDELDFDKIRHVIRYYANGAETIEDTHEAIKKSLPLLKDHHSYFMTAADIKRLLGLGEEDIREIKNGRAPHIASSRLDSLKRSLDYASEKMLTGDVGYVSIPAFDNLYHEGMTMFADSLQAIIRHFDKQHVKGWIVDLRNNGGGAAMPMIAGLGPLLDGHNTFYTVDKEGRKISKAYYKDGGYYDVDASEMEAEPLVQATAHYRLQNQDAPVAVLTNFRTASSAEAVVAILAGQHNVKIIGRKTNGLTSTNSFNFLEDNSALNLTVGYYANRDGQMYKQGIAPDVEVKTNSKADKSAGTDAVLETALNWIENYSR